MRLGTSYFKDKDSAIRYYSYFGIKDAQKVVESKLVKGEIHLGHPPCRHDEIVFLNEEEGRYFKQIVGS